MYNFLRPLDVLARGSWLEEAFPGLSLRAPDDAVISIPALAESFEGEFLDLEGSLRHAGSFSPFLDLVRPPSL